MVVRLLGVIAVFELGALAVMLTLLFGHAYWVSDRTSATQQKYEQRRREVSLLFGSGESVDPVHFRRSSRLDRRVLAEIAANLSGEARESVTDSAREVGFLLKAAQRCQSRRWWIRLRGVREFTLYGDGEDTVPARLDDPKSYVRAAAIAWCAEHQSEPIVKRIISMLADPDLRCRYVAEDTLNRMGNRVGVLLGENLPDASTASRTAALRVAARFADARFLGVSLELTMDPDPLVRARSATLLAAITGPLAEQELVRLIDDESEVVRVAAVRGLGQFQSWKLAPDVARLLHDSAWEVRRAAALALRQIGPGGRLFLRRALHDEDAFAVDIARQVLDVPDA